MLVEAHDLLESTGKRGSYTVVDGAVVYSGAGKKNRIIIILI